MIVRRATYKDIPAIVDLGVESVKKDPLPVKLDVEAMRDTARAALNDAHFLWVAEVDGEVVAALGAVAQQSFWYRGLQVSVLLYNGRRPGAVAPLFREFAAWCKRRSGIKIATLELEPGADPRLIRFLKRLGFTRESVNLTYVREPNVQGR